MFPFVCRMTTSSASFSRSKFNLPFSLADATDVVEPLPLSCCCCGSPTTVCGWPLLMIRLLKLLIRAFSLSVTVLS